LFMAVATDKRDDFTLPCKKHSSGNEQADGHVRPTTL